MPDVTPNRFPRRSALAGAIGAPFLVRFADAAEPAGTVDALSGTATAQAGASVRPLAPDASVFVGDLVATAAQSAIAFRLGSATLVRLGAEARLRIDRPLDIAPLDEGAYRSVRDQRRRRPRARQRRHAVRP